MQQTSPKTISKTTLNLIAGDVVSIGNMFDGFDSYTILGVKPSEHNPRMAIVTIQFKHGGIVDTVHGKNAHWSVIQ